MDPHGEPQDLELARTSASYWLDVCHGREAAEAFVDAARRMVASPSGSISEPSPFAVINEYCALMLPQMPDAIKELAGEAHHPIMAALWETSGETLDMIQRDVSNREPETYGRFLFEYASKLDAEKAGTRLVNLQCSAQLLKMAHACFPAADPNYWRTLLSQARARLRLAELHVERVANLRVAVSVLVQARRIAAEDLAVEMAAHLELAARHELIGLGIDAQEHRRAATELARQLAASVPDDPRDSGAERRRRPGRSHLRPPDTRREMRMVAEAGFHEQLADQGIDVIANLHEASRLYGEASQTDDQWSKNPFKAHCIRKVASISMTLAELDFQYEGRYLLSTRMFHLASELYESGPLHGACLLDEAGAYMRLASAVSDPATKLSHVTKGLELCKEAVPSLRDDAEGQAMRLVTEAHLRESMAELGVDRVTNLTSAQALLEQALQFQEGPVHVAISWQGLGNVHDRLAEIGIETHVNVDTALEYQRQAAEAFEKAGQPVDALHCWTNVGRAAKRHGRWADAYDGFRRAIAFQDEVLARQPIVKDRLHWIAQDSALFRDLAEACFRLERLEELFEVVERGRSRVLSSLMTIGDQLPKGLTAEEIELYRALRRQAEGLDLLSETGRVLDRKHLDWTRLDTSATSERVRAARRELRELDQAYASRDPDRSAVVRPFAFQDLAQFGRRHRRAVVTIWIGEVCGMALIAHTAGDHTLVTLPQASRTAAEHWMFGTTADGQGWQTAYERVQEDDDDEALPSWQAQIDRTLSEVYDVVIRPIHERLWTRGERRVTFLVTAVLGLLPLHATSWVMADGVHYLCEQLEVTYAPSASLFDRCAEREPSAELSVLTVGDPSRDTLDALLFSEWEVERIAELFGETYGCERITPLVGSAATLEAVSREMPRHAIVHIACHGDRDADTVTRTALLLAGDDRLSYDRLTGDRWVDKARLVVLSACESILGYRPDTRSDEYVGLPGAFILAGAKSVVGAHWLVPDAPTAVLMSKLYERLIDGAEVGAALRDAQAWLREVRREEVMTLLCPSLPGDVPKKLEVWLTTLGDRPFSHPYYWASFSAMGWSGQIIQRPTNRLAARHLSAVRLQLRSSHDRSSQRDVGLECFNRMVKAETISQLLRGLLAVRADPYCLEPLREQGTILLTYPIDTVSNCYTQVTPTSETLREAYTFVRYLGEQIRSRDVANDDQQRARFLLGTHVDTAAFALAVGDIKTFNQAIFGVFDAVTQVEPSMAQDAIILAIDLAWPLVWYRAKRFYEPGFARRPPPEFDTAYDVGQVQEEPNMYFVEAYSPDEQAYNFVIFRVPNRTEDEPLRIYLQLAMSAFEVCTMFARRASVAEFQSWAERLDEAVERVGLRRWRFSRLVPEFARHQRIQQ